MSVVRCPTCDTVFAPEGVTTMPFCCERCRLIDLGMWLNEQQGLPMEPEDRDFGEV
jgi:endogenous inhibitor of DNA gyrase (YacG/DUF329 family)